MAKKSKEKIVAVFRGTNRHVARMDGKYVHLADGTKLRILATRLEKMEQSGRPAVDPEQIAQEIQTEPEDETGL